jgi:hypothetical protein
VGWRRYPAYGAGYPADTSTSGGAAEVSLTTGDAYLKFIEDDFLNGARLNPKTDGRPDPRPDVRENAPILGNLAGDFNFNQPPRPPLLLPTNPPTDSPSVPAYFSGRPACLGCTQPPPRGVLGSGRPRHRVL